MYYAHPQVLTESLVQMNEAYSYAARRPLSQSFERIYVFLFGIPEIGLRRRAMAFRRMIRRIGLAQNAQILDAGSGIGAYALSLARAYPQGNVTGIDLDPRKVALSGTVAGSLAIRNVRFLREDLTRLDSSWGQFDLVINIDVLEHVPDPQATIRSLCALTRPGGFLYVHVPQPVQNRIFRGFGAWHHEDHVREGISADELIGYLAATDLRVVRVRQTFGLLGKLAWELNHAALSRSRFLAGLTFPILLPLAALDSLLRTADGLGVELLAQKVQASR